MPFQSTLPARGATFHGLCMHRLQGLFQSTLPARGATSPVSPPRSSVSFQSTLPARGATRTQENLVCLNIFQSTLPARGATRRRSADGRGLLISIHAPREGSDGSRHGLVSGNALISIHAPREGSDSSTFTRIMGALLFQSTLPARGATCWAAPSLNLGGNFNPRSPRGERRSGNMGSRSCPRFQSTLPARGATWAGKVLQGHGQNFNPRSPRGERPQATSELWKTLWNFNPRSPRGERLYQTEMRGLRVPFQSTLPARGATSLDYIIGKAYRFQSTLPARGATLWPLTLVVGILGFQSTLPARGATLNIFGYCWYNVNFNPRSPRGERQQMCTNIHLQACKTSIKFNLAPQKPSNHTALILRKKGAVLVRSSQVMYGH